MSISEVTVSALLPSVKAGDIADLSCTVKASDAGNDILWFKEDSSEPLPNDSSSYTITTTMAESTQPDGKTMISSSVLTVLDFDLSDVGSYHCRVDYNDPILDDDSIKQAVAILGNKTSGYG